MGFSKRWSTIFSGLPSKWINCWSNYRFKAMPHAYHLFAKLVQAYKNRDLFLAWITGNGHNIMGFKKESPHPIVYQLVDEQAHPGVYQGDLTRETDEVFNLAARALSEVAQPQNFLCFIHFRDTDSTGHKVILRGLEDDYEIYLPSALLVDGNIHELMDLLPTATDILYCSDHGSISSRSAIQATPISSLPKGCWL